ncbi:unnamed protein product [Diabrotica balteata]|uniref:phosphopyruvate hydratase n=1 Tax=Diabrotica balteata TaxID=107213 RepID=A0A9N9SY77_DIABA|nr:unnamed protein product [Diabrotica balteata]
MLVAELKLGGLDATAVGDEGGFAPNILNNKDGLELIKVAIANAGYTGKIEIGVNVAASEFHKEGKYDLDFKNPNFDKSKWITPDQLLDLYQEFIKEYPIVFIEDPFDQDDRPAWTKITAATFIQIVGDDLTVTNPKRIQTAVEKKACNCLLLKVNQIDTVAESIQAHNLAKANGWGTMVSHRSSETEDTFIADLVVGLSTGQIKTGAPCTSERLAKYNQILRIEEELGSAAKMLENHSVNLRGSKVLKPKRETGPMDVKTLGIWRREKTTPADERFFTSKEQIGPKKNKPRAPTRSSRIRCSDSWLKCSEKTFGKW